jgi:hypothetical protein
MADIVRGVEMDGKKGRKGGWRLIERHLGARHERVFPRVTTPKIFMSSFSCVIEFKLGCFAQNQRGRFLHEQHC